MDSQVLVSVAMISYKHAKYIRQALESVLEQNVNFKYEIIIGDDCSEDGTKEILMEYKKKYPDIIFPIINEKNLGASVNSYNVQLNCKGKYITTLESDDFWCNKDKLKRQVEYLEKHPEIAAVGSNYYNVDENGEKPVVALSKFEVNKIYYMNDYMYHGFRIHGNTLMRRNNFPLTNENYKKVRFCTPTMGDVFTRCLLYDQGGIYVFPEIMMCHRDGRENVTSFTYQSHNNAMKYTHMLKDITDNMNIYFGGKYDFTPKVCTRLATLYLASLTGKLKIDKKEYRDFKKSLQMKYRLLTNISILYFCGYKLKKKLVK